MTLFDYYFLRFIITCVAGIYIIGMFFAFIFIKKKNNIRRDLVNNYLSTYCESRPRKRTRKLTNRKQLKQLKNL